MAYFQCGLCTTQGRRGYQEDAAAVWPSQVAGRTTPDATFNWSLPALPPLQSDETVAVLADGMGGHAGGALASQTVCETFIESWANALACDTASGRTIGEMHARLHVALQACNLRIKNISQTNPALSGMGSTLVGVIFAQSSLEWISVGDSPLYLYRREEIALLNEDHSLAPALDKLAHDGKITAEQARGDPRRHMLRSAVTGENLDLIDVSRRPLNVEGGDYIVVASDGIHTLDNAQLADTIAAYAARGPHAVAEAIVHAIENADDPYQDNATVIAVKVVV